jgi:L-fucose isomerase-like protein
MAKAPIKYIGVRESTIKSIKTRRRKLIREIFTGMQIADFWDEEFMLEELKANIHNESDEIKRRLEASGL